MFIRTTENVLIQVNPATKIPRTYKRFAGLFAQLLKNLKIRAVNTSQTLLKIIKNPITDHIPINTFKVGTSTKAELVKIKDFAEKVNFERPIAFIVGAVARGNPGMECGYADEIIKISNYSLSASNCLYRIIGAYEEILGIE